MGTVLEEADESCYWIELIIESRMMNARRMEPLLQEARELTAIFAQTCKTVRRRDNLKS